MVVIASCSGRGAWVALFQAIQPCRVQSILIDRQPRLKHCLAMLFHLPAEIICCLGMAIKPVHFHLVIGVR